MDTILVLGDQLNRSIGALADAVPGDVRVLVVESAAKVGARPWHRQRAHAIVASMRRFVDELRAAGFEVDHRRAPTMRAGIEAHRRQRSAARIVATEPNSEVADRLLRDLDVTLVRSHQFLCHRDDFATWAAGRRGRRTMEDFYRWQRRRLGYLMDGDVPAGGRWNYDVDNREPPPTDGRAWPRPPRSRLDELDEAVLAELPASCWGAEPDGTWPTSRRMALARLRHVVDQVLANFGPHEDAMLSTNWHLAHTLLSMPLNLGLLLPGEVCDAAEEAYRSGRVPLASAEGFIRQVIGWREYVWGTYWLELAAGDYRRANALDAHRPLPPVYRGAPTEMRCVASVLADVHDRGWTHHIPRLMVLGNLALLAGVDPLELDDWMWAAFVDGAEWVMLPNVIGMSQHADGGRMATKPYAAGGNYIDRMSDFCGSCRFDRRRRTGEDACPFTTLYWDFVARHTDRFASNPRMAQPVRAAQRLSDLPDVRRRAREVLDRLDRGEL